MMEWLRNLFKSHAQKRIEARRREEEAWRATYREARKSESASSSLKPKPDEELNKVA